MYLNLPGVMKISAILIVCFIHACPHGYSQQAALSVQRFEYIWQPNADDAFKRLILASNDSIKQRIEKSFAYALQQRWNLSMPENVLTVKPVSVFSFSDAPKFNTKIKDRQPGVWYLFLQIFDKKDFVFDYDTDSSVCVWLALKCKIIDGSNDSVILDRNLSVKIYKAMLPQDQVVLTMLPAYPAHFARSFDSIATWLFQPECGSE